MWNHSIVIPFKFHVDVINQLYSAHLGIVKIRKFNSKLCLVSYNKKNSKSNQKAV